MFFRVAHSEVDSEPAACVCHETVLSDDKNNDGSNDTC